MAEINWYDQMTKPAAPAVPKADADVDWYREMIGTGESVREESEPLPSGPGGVIDRPEAGATNWQILRSTMPPNTADQIQRFAERLFPGIPIDEAAKRFGVDGEGNIYYADPASGQLTLAIPTIGGQTGWIDKLKAGTAQVAAGVWSLVPQAAGGLAGALTRSPSAATAVSSGVAGVTDILRQGADRLLAGEKPVLFGEGQNIDYGNAAWQALGAGTGEGVGRLVGRGAEGIYNRNPGLLEPVDVPMVQASPALSAEAARRAAVADQYGSYLTLGEATDLPAQLSRERFLRTTPQGAGMATAARQRLKTDVPRAVASEIPQPASIHDTIVNLRGAAGDVIQRFEANRAATAGPAYQSIMLPDNNLDPAVFDTLKTDPLFARTLARIRSNPAWQRSLGNLPDSNIQVLDAVKRNIDDQIEAARRQGNNNLVRQLVEAKNSWLADIDAAFKADGVDYAAARQAWAQASPDVNLSHRILAKFADAEGAGVGAQLDNLFMSTRTSPEEVAQARFLFAASGKLDAWNDAVNGWLAHRFANVTRNAGRDGNVAYGFWNDVWKDNRQRQIIETAFGNDPAAIDRLGTLFTYLESVGRALPEGSPTGANAAQAAAERARSAGGMLKQILTGGIFSPQSIGTAATNQVASNAYENRLLKLVEIATDPANARTLDNLRILGPRAKLIAPSITKLLTQAGLFPQGADYLAPEPVSAPSETAPLRPY